jgi:hypothetical protein
MLASLETSMPSRSEPRALRCQPLPS